jgi:hypothetical protein
MLMDLALVLLLPLAPAYCKLDRIEKGTYTLSHISYRRLWFQVVRQTGDKLLDFIINIAEQEVRS